MQSDNINIVNYAARCVQDAEKVPRGGINVYAKKRDWGKNFKGREEFHKSEQQADKGRSST